MKRRALRGGYVGLIAILIGVAILALLYAGEYLSPAPRAAVSPEGELMATTTTALDAAHQNVDAAKALEQRMNRQNQEINDALGE